MVPDISRIPIATDLPENARYAFGYAADLTDCYKAGTTVLHALEQIPHTPQHLVIDIFGKERRLLAGVLSRPSSPENGWAAIRRRDKTPRHDQGRRDHRYAPNVLIEHVTSEGLK